MKTRIVMLGMCWFALSAHAADPRAGSAEECVAFADLALVASTLAKHGIGKDQTAKMLPDMYQLSTDNAQEIARRIVEAAYRQQQPDPQSFATTIGSSCIRHEGRFDSVLGASV